MFEIIIAAFVVLIVLAVIIYLLPSDGGQSARVEKKSQSPKVAKPKEKPAMVMPDSVKLPEVPTKDWQAIALRWEKQNQQLQQQLEEHKQQVNAHQKQMQSTEQKIAVMQEAIDQERNWREKEQVTLNKFKHHEQDLKQQIIRTESDLEKEHSQRIRLSQELQELKVKWDSLQEEKRELAVKAMSLETELTAVNKQLALLKSENIKLKEKREDVQWVAKSEFDQISRKYDQLLADYQKLKSAA
jgi:chromosome segregation ATPase